MDTIERIWRRDFANVAASVPDEWLVHLDDGFGGDRARVSAPARGGAVCEAMSSRVRTRVAVTSHCRVPIH